MTQSHGLRIILHCRRRDIYYNKTLAAKATKEVARSVLGMSKFAHRHSRNFTLRTILSNTCSPKHLNYDS